MRVSCKLVEEGGSVDDVEADGILVESEAELGGREDEAGGDVMAAAKPSKNVTDVATPGIRELWRSEQQPWYIKSLSQHHFCTNGQ